MLLNARLYVVAKMPLPRTRTELVVRGLVVVDADDGGGGGAGGAGCC